MRYMFSYDGVTFSCTSVEKVGRSLFLYYDGRLFGDINLLNCSVKLINLSDCFKIYNVSRRVDNGK